MAVIDLDEALAFNITRYGTLDRAVQHVFRSLPNDTERDSESYRYICFSICTEGSSVFSGRVQFCTSRNPD